MTQVLVGSQIVAGPTAVPDAVGITQGLCANSLQGQGTIEGFFLLPVSVITPTKVSRFREYLVSYCDKGKADFLLNGFTNGFDLGFRGPVIATAPKNARSMAEHKQGVWEAIHKELCRGHTSGPFHCPPFPITHVLPMGAFSKPDQSIQAQNSLILPHYPQSP